MAAEGGRAKVHVPLRRPELRSQAARCLKRSPCRELRRKVAAGATKHFAGEEPSTGDFSSAAAKRRLDALSAVQELETQRTDSCASLRSPCREWQMQAACGAARLVAVSLPSAGTAVSGCTFVRLGVRHK